jgi:predicted phosphoadenosine phosphosulfate sulfurtransferase
MKRKINTYINRWRSQGYPEGLPDEAPAPLESLNKVGSYRLICIALMKNDVTLKTLGFSRPLCPLYSALKRQELIARGTIPLSELDRQDVMF